MLIKYTLSAVLGTSPAFAGNNRDASFSPVADAALTVKIMSNGAGGTSVKFLRNASINIVRARLVSSGAQKLEPAVGKNAAEVLLSLSGQGSSVSPFTLAFSKWNEWEDKQVSVDVGEGGALDLNVVASGTTFRYDDFNVYDAFEGQTFTAILELEIESCQKNLVDATDPEIIY